MNQQVKEKWVEALRSGKYQQGILYLKQGNNYCCLGVLCDLFIQENHKIKWENTGARHNSILDSTSALPDIIREWSGLSEDTETDLMEMNDRDGECFYEIANFINENL